MTNVIELKTKVDRLWDAADAAHQRGRNAYIEFGNACAQLNDAGITQAEIAARYDMSQSTVTHAIAVGRDQRINSITINQLPRSDHTLYLLTTLDDAGFAKLAKPDTTQADVLAYKQGNEPAAKPAAKGRPRQGSRPKGWLPQAYEAGLIGPQAGSHERNAAKAALSKHTGFEVGRVKTPEESAAIADAIERVKVERGEGPTGAQLREALPKTAQEKLDAAVRRYRRELDAQYAERLADMERAICAEVERRLPDHARQRIERALAQVEDANFLQRSWRGRMETCTAAVALFFDTWRTLAQCLHPDRAPEDRREQFRNASVQLNLLKAAFDKIPRD